MARNREEQERREERQRILNLVAAMYAEGFADGIERVVSRWPDRMAQHAIPATDRLGGKVSVRLDLVGKAVDSYLKAVEEHAVALRAAGVEGTQLLEAVTGYADRLANDKAALIAKTEWATARMDGAGTIVDESGEEFEWRFPHFETASPEHEECLVCEAIRQGSPYSTAAAEAEGYPNLPHPNCDHGWVLVPKGEATRTEQFPQDNQRTRDIPRHPERPRL